MLKNLRDVARRLGRTVERMVEAMPPPTSPSDPLEALVEEALWDLYEEEAIQIIQYQRLRGAKALVLIAPNDHQRDILKALVECARELRLEPATAAAAVDPQAASTGMPSTREKGSL